MTATAKKTTKKSATAKKKAATTKKAAKAAKTPKTPEPTPPETTTPVVAESKPAKAEKAEKVREAKPKKMSAIDAAAKVLVEAGAAMNTKEMIDAMAAKGYWTSPGGKTPHATLYSAILREITTKGKDARFAKIERGKFASNGAA